MHIYEYSCISTHKQPLCIDTHIHIFIYLYLYLCNQNPAIEKDATAFTKEVYINRMLWFQGIAARWENRMVFKEESPDELQGGGFGLSLVDVGVSGPFPCVTPLFGSHLPLSVPVSVPVVVVMVVVTCRPVVVRALLVPFIMVLFALLGAVVSRAVGGLVRSTAVVVVVVMVVVVPVGQWLVTLLLLGVPLP